jgi:hypothetical protein
LIISLDSTLKTNPVQYFSKRAIFFAFYDSQGKHLDRSETPVYAGWRAFQGLAGRPAAARAPDAGPGTGCSALQRNIELLPFT